MIENKKNSISATFRVILPVLQLSNWVIENKKFEFPRRSRPKLSLELQLKISIFFNGGFGIWKVSGFRFRDLGFRFRDLGFRFRDLGFWFQDLGFRFRDLGFGILDSGSRIQVSGFGI